MAAADQLCGSVTYKICSQLRKRGMILKALGTFPLRYFFMTSLTPSYISFTLKIEGRRDEMREEAIIDEKWGKKPTWDPILRFAANQHH